MEDNIYVKDIYSNNEVLGYWKYIVDGIPYYIPNYGYILLIDSNFKDVDTEDVLEAVENDVPQQHKIISTIYNENNNLNPNPVTENDIKRMCYQDFKNTINPNNFNLRRTQDGLVQPTSSVLNLLGRLFADNSSENITDYIHKYLKKFLHNRIGNYLTTSERENIQNINRPRFIKGEMIVQRVRYNTYVWAQYVGEDLNPDVRNRVRIYTRNDPSDPEPIERSVPIGNLRKYVSFEQVKQNYDNNRQNLDEDRLLETYVL